jgi:hypothetical protein
LPESGSDRYRRSNVTTPPRFAVDTMLGRLARWLRLLGYDAAYGAHLSGRSLLRAARAEGRIVLTRRRDLVRRLDLPHLLVDSDHFREQLVQVMRAFGLDAREHLLERCPECNLELLDVTPASARPRVPEYVAQTQQRFRSCPRCHRVYWPGTHHEHIGAELAALGFET